MHKTHQGTGRQKRWTFRILATLFLSSLVAVITQTGIVPTATPAFAGKPIPSFVEGRVLYSSRKGVGCLTETALESVKVNKGKTERAPFVTIPFSNWFNVSPSGNFILWTEEESGPVFLGRISQGKLTQKYPLKDTEGYRLDSWSPDGDLFLLVRNQSDIPREYRVVDAVSGSSTVLDIGTKQKDREYIQTFWAPKGKSLVFANRIGSLGGHGSAKIRKAQLWQYNVTTYDGEISVQNPRVLTSSDAEHLLGTTFVTAMSLWERNLYGQYDAYGSLMGDYLPTTLVSPSRHKAIVMGRAIPVKDAPWVNSADGYDAFLCEGKTVRRIKLRSSISRYSTWNSDEHWVHTLTEGSWRWIRAEQGSPVEENVAIGNMTQGTPRQTLPF